MFYERSRYFYSYEKSYRESIDFNMLELNIGRRLPIQEYNWIIGTDNFGDW